MSSNWHEGAGAMTRRRPSRAQRQDVEYGEKVARHLAAMDLGHDIALLKAPASGAEGGYPYLRVAEKMPGVASDVYLFGAPQFRHAVFVRGSIARAEPDLREARLLAGIGYEIGNYLDRDPDKKRQP